MEINVTFIFFLSSIAKWSAYDLILKFSRQKIQDSARDKWRTWANFWRRNKKNRADSNSSKGCAHKAANEKGESEGGGRNFRRFSVCNPYRFLTLFLAMFFISLFLFPSFLCPCFTKWLPAFCFECLSFSLFFFSLDCRFFFSCPPLFSYSLWFVQ